jgi:hypothetical protein
MKPNENLNLFLQPRTEVAVLPIENKSILTSDRSDLSLMASRIIESVDDGFADALDTYIMAKKGSYVFDGIVEGLKGKVQIPEGKNYEKYHCAIREQQTGVKYYFEGCNDPVWAELSNQLAAIKFQLKDRETWLKSFTKPTQVEAEANEDGEEIAPARVINPPVKSGGISAIVTIKTAKEDE